MIILKLWGGLGNQLFQYAYGYQLAKKLNTELFLDISYYKKLKLRQPILLELNLEFGNIISEEKLPWGVNFFNRKNPNRIIRIPTYTCLNIGKKFRYLKETRFRYNKKLQEYARKNTYLDGYWQCPKYFDRFRDDLILQFKLKNATYTEEITNIIKDMEKNESVAVHIRHGDYESKNKWYNNMVILDKRYYDYTIEQAKKLLNNPNFYFFTDDPDWVKHEFSDLENSFIVSGNVDCRDIDEIFLISKCKHQIIANSTFSWWGAWLNEYESKQVWAPQNCFGFKDTLPDTWNKVNSHEYHERCL